VIDLKKEIKASVRDIVDFVYSEGDILPAMVQKHNLHDGTIIHQEIQKSDSGEKEVFLKFNYEVDDYEFYLQGRIDILDKNGDTYHIIEIKSTHSFEGLSETKHLAHFAQAKFYGLMLYDKLELDKSHEIDISVLYVNRYNYERKYFTRSYSYPELESFFIETINRYLQFQKAIDAFHERKLASISQLSFPYPEYRKGQLDLINHVQETIEANNNCFICAPTGIGKSLGTIYPAIMSLKYKEDKIFYLTAKSIIKDVARSSINLMREHSNLKIKSLVLTAKDKICINDCVKCNPKDCPYARDFYGKLNDAVIDIYENEDDFDYHNILFYAKKHEICPFEYQLSLALYSEIIIGDYNYVFDIRVYLRRFFDYDTKQLILLIDEAHNMYDRVCNMFTTKINMELFNQIISLVNHEKEISKSAKSLLIKLNQYQNHLQNNRKKAMKFRDLDEVLLDDIGVMLSKLEKYFIKENENHREINEDLLNHYFDLANFYKLSDYYSPDFMIWVSNSKEDCEYQITCLNPRELIKMRTDNVMSTCFFSATLHPIEYYLSLLGGDENCKVIILDSPFKKDNLQLLINPYISTKYYDRENTKYQITDQIFAFISSGGKYMIYFPSYKYLEIVYQVFVKLNETEFEIIRQNPYMTETERLDFINQFDETKKNIIGFAVLGGVFAEGIDLKGDKLNGVCIIGVGLPMFDDFRNELKLYFDEVYHKGYQYAYMYPGFNKVLQAVGRVIRDESDLGKALLIDNRYLNKEYLQLYPKHWSHYRILKL
jgi:DNA excision repair protein ERCC-2